MTQTEDAKRKGAAMTWAILVGAGLMEAVWAVSLQRSEGVY